MPITLGAGPAVPASNTAVTITLTAGRSVVVTVAWEGASSSNPSEISTVAFTGAGNGNATLIGSSRISGNGRATKLQLAYLKSVATGGSQTISVTFSGGTPSNYQLSAVEFVDADTASFYDGVTQSGADSPGVDTVTVTPASQNSLVFGHFFSAGQDDTPVPTVTGYTSYFLGLLNGGWYFGYYLLDTGADTTPETLTTGNTNAGYWVWQAATFKLGGSAANQVVKVERGRALARGLGRGIF